MELKLIVVKLSFEDGIEEKRCIQQV